MSNTPYTKIYFCKNKSAENIEFYFLNKIDGFLTSQLN